jgi:hypothetical protein
MSQVLSEIDRAAPSSAILATETYPPKRIATVVGHHNWNAPYMDERDFRLQLLAIKEVKEKSYTSGMVDTIESNAHATGFAHAERNFVFGDKKFLEPKDLKKIRELLTGEKYGFVVDFINNSPANVFVKTKLTYHELLIKYDEHKRPVAAVMLMSTGDKTACYDLEINYVGHAELGLDIQKATDKWTKRRVFQATFKTAKNILDYGDGPFVTFREEILEKDAEMALPSFYPQFTREWGMTVQKFAQTYAASRAPVLLLYGPTGTGKTTFVRTMAKELNAVVVATSDMKIASSSALIDTYRDMLKQAMEDNDPRPHILLLEDLDALLMSRLNNNREMARLLNETKGITSNKGIYIIFSTNLTDLKDVDQALLRPGRCFAKVNIGRMTLPEANIVRKDLGYDDFDLKHLADDDGNVSLAEAIEELRVVEEAKNVQEKLKGSMGAPVLAPF